MKLSLMLIMIGVVILLLGAAPLIIGGMNTAYSDMNSSVAVGSPNRVGVDIGYTLTAGISSLIFPAAVLVLGAFCIMGIWMFIKAVGGK